MSAQMDLLDWKPACRIIAFPLVNRIGRIREVAGKLHEKSTDRAVDYYRRQVTEGMIGHLDRLGIPERDQDEELGAFWTAVDLEIARLTYRSQRPGGDVA